MSRQISGEKKKNRPDKPMSRQMSQHRAQHQDQRNMKKKFQRWRCHYCGRFGHIKPFCFRLHGYPNQVPYVKRKTNKVSYTQQWKKKTAALIAHTSLRVFAKEDWYFDSGCSKHMTGIKNLLNDVKPHSTSFVTFGDGAKGEIKGVGNLDCSGVVINDDQEVVMRGVRSKDNCYIWESKNTNLSFVCSTDKDEEEVKLWHQELDQLHLRGMKRINSMEVVRRIPRLHTDKGRVCDKCNVGK